MSRPSPAPTKAPVIPEHQLVVPLADVARLTGWSERSLLDDCRAGVIDHVGRKGSYGLTPAQLDALIARHTVKGSGDQVSARQREADELEEARQHNARSGRGGGRVAA
jgi:pyruvate/oxaloacetate carboxyltransferase